MDGPPKFNIHAFTFLFNDMPTASFPPSISIYNSNLAWLEGTKEIA